MKFGSLFSGIGGFDLGFEQSGLECVWQVEIDNDCQKVLARRFPNVSRYMDVKDVERLPSVDVICGGFPCQDLSVAGKRKGLAGERSGLWFEFLRVIKSNLPRWVVIENVPGLLSSDEGRDFAAILRGLVECGYCLAWRNFDAQYAGVAQRRRRVFIVGSLGNGSCAEILFESESVSWNPPTRREARPGVTPILEAGARTNGNGHRDGDGIGVEGDPMFTLQSGKQHAVSLGADGELARSLTSCKTATGRLDPNEQNFIIAEAVDVRNLRMQPDGTSGTLQHKKSGGYSLNYQNPVLAFSSKDHGADAGEIAPTLRAQNFDKSHINGGGQVAIAFSNRGNECGAAETLRSDSHGALPMAMVETLQPQGYNMAHASPQETDAREVLRALREEIGEESFAQWGLGILDSFQSPEVLQSNLHGEGVRGSEENRSGLDDSASSRTADLPSGAMRKVREAGRRRRPPQKRRLAGQLAEQLRADLSKLSHEGPSAQRFLCGLREASEGLGTLQQALNQISEVWRSDEGQAGNNGELVQSQAKENRGVRTYGVRRLTPL